MITRASAPDLDDACAQRLAAGCRELNVAVDGAVQVRLLDYLALLDKWNRAYNLTAVRAPLDLSLIHI